FIKNDSIYSFSTERNEVISPGALYKSKDSLWISSTSGIQVFGKNKMIDVGLLNHSNIQIFYKKLSAIKEKNRLAGELLNINFLNPENKQILLIQNDSIQIYDWNFNFKKNLKISPPLSIENEAVIKQG